MTEEEVNRVVETIETGYPAESGNAYSKSNLPLDSKLALALDLGKTT